jgi:hypothetical protein
VALVRMLVLSGAQITIHITMDCVLDHEIGIAAQRRQVTTIFLIIDDFIMIIRCLFSYIQSVLFDDISRMTMYDILINLMIEGASM